jgi:hypothetical protein
MSTQGPQQGPSTDGTLPSTHDGGLLLHAIFRGSHDTFPSDASDASDAASLTPPSATGVEHASSVAAHAPA